MNNVKYDVYYARGHGVSSLPGNQFYRQLIRQNSCLYKKSSTQNNQKDRIANDIIQTITSNGGRFFSRENTTSPWEKLVPSDAKLKRKIKQSLRDVKKVGLTDDSNDSVHVQSSDVSNDDDYTIPSINVNECWMVRALELNFGQGYYMDLMNSPIDSMESVDWEDISMRSFDREDISMGSFDW